MGLTWQNDWNTFVRLISEHFRQGIAIDQLNSLLDSQQVIWSGTLTERSIDDLAPCVAIALPAAETDLGDLGSVQVGEQSLPVARDSVSDWQALPIGTWVSFSATLGTPIQGFPPFEVIRLSSGRVLVMIRLKNGRPCLSDGKRSDS
jgi:hypothetical protein